MSARKMKDSGIEWIGEIPEEWEISKVSYFYKITLGKMLQPNAKEESDTLENYLCALNVFWNKITTDNIKQMWFEKSEKKQYELTDGDLIVTEGGDVAAACIWEGEVNPCYIQNAVYRVRSLPGFLNKFLYYHLFVAKTTGYIDMLCNKATIAHFTKDKFSNLPFIVLPLKEQQKIVAYLDEKCAAIDQIVASKQKQNEQLAAYRQSLITEAVTKGLNPAVPMKDSGIEWIGEITVEWEVSALKYNANLVAEKSGEMNSNRVYIGLENVLPYVGKIALGDEVETIGDTLSFCTGDVLFGKLRPYLAKCFFAEFDGVCSGEFFVIRDNGRMIGKYIKYLMLSEPFLNLVIGSTYGVKMPRASWEFVGNIKLPRPPLAEQKAIAAYLDKKCGEIDALSERNKNIIESLQEYKQSLIYEAVTGKIEL